jgi:hypothetical protein
MHLPAWSSCIVSKLLVCNYTILRVATLSGIYTVQLILSCEMRDDMRYAISHQIGLILTDVICNFLCNFLSPAIKIVSYDLVQYRTISCKTDFIVCVNRPLVEPKAVELQAQCYYIYSVGIRSHDSWLQSPCWQAETIPLDHAVRVWRCSCNFRSRSIGYRARLYCVTLSGAEIIFFYKQKNSDGTEHP